MAASFRDNAALSERELNGSPVGPPAMTSCEPRQVRKEATVAVTSCAGVWLAGLSPFLLYGILVRYDLSCWPWGLDELSGSGAQVSTAHIS